MGGTGDPVVTANLVLRRPTSADESGYLEVFMRREVVAWLRPEPLPPLRVPDVQAMLGDDIRHWNQVGFGPWAMIDAERKSYLGRAGLRHTAVEGEPAIELAWTVDPARQNQGLATESALAALELARELGLEEIVALVLPANRASRRVAEKTGLQADGEVEHAGLTHVLYRLALA
jgi:RimJ/RimL family protein N-acetyltransferase